MKELVSLLKIESMSSLEIATLTGKQHKTVLRDIRDMIEVLKDGTDLYHVDIKGVLITLDERGYYSLVNLDKVHTMTLITGYSVKLRKAVMGRWQFLEDELAVLKYRQGDKKRQIDAMASLQDMLPDDLQGEALSYIKANTVVNKATSNLFGFPKMLKKDEMSQDMLAIRDKILDDYIKLYDILESNGKVKDILYDKYQPLRLNHLQQK